MICHHVGKKRFEKVLSLLGKIGLPRKKKFQHLHIAQVGLYFKLQLQ